MSFKQEVHAAAASRTHVVTARSHLWPMRHDRLGRPGLVTTSKPGQSSMTLAEWPIDQTNRRRRIAIVGAGISGLAAAWLLKRAGHEVSLFEASNTAGGRIKTLRDRFTNGLCAEAGAMRIPDHHHQTLWLAARFGLRLVPFRNACGQALAFVNGRRFTLDALPDDATRLGFAVDKSERGRSARRLFETAIVRAVRSLCDLPDFELADVLNDVELRPGVAGTVFAALDRMSLGQFLRQVSGLSGAAADYVSALLSFEAHQSASMAAILSDHKGLNASSAFWQIAGGMDALTRGFLGEKASHGDRADASGSRVGSAPDLSNEIVFNARVLELSKNGRGLSLRYENPTTRREHESSAFDRVIVSAPFSALRHVRWNGLASSHKQRAIRRLHYDNACKIFLEFEEAFWRRGAAGCQPITGGHSITDRPIRAIHYPTDPPVDGRTERAVLLASYTWADDSLRWTALRHDDRIRFALRDLADVHGVKPSTLEKICVAGVSHSWAEHEFTSGAVAMFEPHQRTELFADVWQPEGMVHYCGEHTSGKHGWIEGAVESAVRVASEVCESIGMGTVRRAEAASGRRGSTETAVALNVNAGPAPRAAPSVPKRS